MRKINGGVAIAVLFVFLIVSLVFLWILTLTNKKTIRQDSQSIGMQSSYYAESLGYLAYFQARKDGLFQELYIRDENPLPNPKWKEAEGSAILRKKELPEEFSNFSLAVNSKYKGIETNVEIQGKLYKEIFQQEDGFLSWEELESAPGGTFMKEKLGGNFYEKNRYIGEKIYTISQKSILTQEKTYIEVAEEIQGVDGAIERSFLFRLPAYHRGVLLVNEELEIPSPGNWSGIVKISSEGIIKGNLTINGILILEKGAQIQGNVECKGLVIGEESFSPWISTKFVPGNVEEMLGNTDFFEEVKILRLKKSIE